MITNRELLEQDRERFLSMLSQSDSPDRAVRIAEEELNRILIRYNEQAGNPVIAEQNSSVYETAKAALSLMNTTGEVQVYERTATTDPSAGRQNAGSGKRGFSAAVLPFFTGIASGAAGLFLIAEKILMPAAGILALISVGGLFFAGIRYAGGSLLPHRNGKKAIGEGPGSGTASSDNLRIEVSQDADKIYHALLGIVTVIDQTLAETALQLEMDSDGKETSAGMPASSVPVAGKDPGAAELAFLQNLLATAYGDRKNTASAQIISDIRFHLHGQGIEVLDYDFTLQNTQAGSSSYPGLSSPSATDIEARRVQESAFARLPGGVETTLRPALVRNGEVLLKGLASGM